MHQLKALTILTLTWASASLATAPLHPRSKQILNVEGLRASAENAKGSAETPSLDTCYRADLWTCEVEAAIVRLTNEKRQKPLTQDFESSFVARTWSEAQAKARKISHAGFPEQRKSVLNDEFSTARWTFRAENVGMIAGRANADTEAIARSFVAMWHDSPGHRKNMLGPYTFIGVGVKKVGNTIYATQLFH